jgi:flagellar basal-body rod modification protein FlgD
MQAISAAAPVTSAPATSTAPTGKAQNVATNAFGLGFDSLLKIILTQLTYQDPLKPMDNYQFVSQLAQFSQIQLSQTTNDQLTSLVSAQATLQAAGLFGRKVDIPSGSATITGKVTAVSFDNGDPKITIQTSDNQTISGIALSSISQIRQGD